MALVEAVAAIPSPSCFCRSIHSAFLFQHSILRFVQTRTLSRTGVSNDRGSRFCLSTLKAARVAGTTRIVENLPATSATVEIPLTCYQLLGVPDEAEKDEIVKSVMQLKRAEVEEGYTMDAVKSREDRLMDLRDKLLFEPQYAGDITENIPPKSSIRIPWAWLPGALCLLQEVGEETFVFEIGGRALQHPEAKTYAHDILLSMALAECAIAKSGFEKNKVAQGFAALARAQCLLRSKISLGKMALLSQVEESLEELAPACTLELLGMPHSPQNAEQRRGAVEALRELLRQGLDVESTCRVQDWPCFLNQALTRLMATEIVDLVSWVDLVFNKAKLIIECLMASDGVDLKFEEGFCLFLLGQVNEAEAVERLKLLDMNSNSSLQKSKDFKRNKLSMELWLKESVLNVFPDTRHCSPSLVNFFNSDKKAYETKKNKGSFQKFPAKIHRPLATALASERRESLPNVNSFQHLGSAAKQLTFLQSQEISGKGSGIALVKMERKLGSHSSSTFWGTLLAIKEIVGRAWLEGFLHLVAKKDMVVGRIIFVTVLGCIIFTLSGRSRTTWTYGIHRPDGKSLVLPSDSYKNGRGRINRSCIAGAMKKLLAKVRVKFADAKKTLKPSLYASRISMKDQSMQMPVEEAESLVKQWQAIKAEALGPGHQVHSLSDILDGSMLAQWHALADSARTKSCYWRFVLLQMSILRAEILSDARGSEIAEVDALLEEAAELVDGSLPKKPNYHSFYKTRYLLERQYDGSWKFCKVDVENPFEMLNQVR